MSTCKNLIFNKGSGQVYKKKPPNLEGRKGYLSSLAWDMYNITTALLSYAALG